MSDTSPLPESQPEAALDFLRWLSPLGPWVLTAIQPDVRKAVTVTFAREQEGPLLAWVAEKNAQSNVYYTLNGLARPVDKKPMKEDIQEVRFLHVDLDPNKGEAPEAAKARLGSALAAFSPLPSAVVDSGGGLQALWRLDEPLWVGGDLTQAAGAEAYNQQLEIVLGGDHCWNIDRILRLPGTVNWPDEKKRARGRVPALASVVSRTDAVQPLSAFTAAPRTQAAAPPGVIAQVKISGNLPPVNLEELPEAVTNRTKMLIVQGEDPDDPERYGSRSEAAWAVMCALLRAKCEPDVVASIMLDPDYGISGHILAQRRPTDYLARQLQRAQEAIVEPMLAQMNEKHAVIADLGGRCRVVSEVWDPVLKRNKISKQSFEDIRNRYLHVRVEVGKDSDGNAKYMAAGSWWLLHPMRRQYDVMVFAPGQDPPGAYNLWKGFACEAMPGRAHEPWLRHVRDNICSGDERVYEYLMNWCARLVQHPDEAGQVAVVMRGGEGSGKGTFAKELGLLFGRHFLQIANAKHLVGQFNAHLRDCVMIFADEAFFAGDKQHEGVLKTLVTEEMFMAEAKGVDAEAAANFTHLVMATNSDWAIPAGADARRFLMINTSDERKQDPAYFREIRAAMRNGGRESLLFELLNRDISEFEVRDVPKTEALGEQKLHSLSAEEQWLLERLMDGRVTALSPGWETEILKDRLKEDYQRYCEGQRIMRRVSPTVLGRFLSRIMPEGYPRSTQRWTDVERTGDDGYTITRRERAYWYSLPSLEECRAAWDTRYGSTGGWPEEEADGGPDEPQPRLRVVGGADPF